MAERTGNAGASLVGIIFFLRCRMQLWYKRGIPEGEYEDAGRKP